MVGIAASAGGIGALTAVLQALPVDFGAPILIVQHLDPKHPSLLAAVLGRRSLLPVESGVHGTALLPGHIYVAPPDRHLTIRPPDILALDGEAQAHHVRPSADRLFHSLAHVCGRRAVAVVVSGMGRDGAEGAAAVKRAGGRVIAQQPEEAEYAAMPRAVIATGCVDEVLPAERIGARLTEIAGRR